MARTKTNDTEIVHNNRVNNISKKKRYRLRIIIPAFPAFNIYTNVAKQTTALGPVCVASIANKLENWDVEVIDENNCQSKLCPFDKDGLPDHRELQSERPADAVGFYGSLTSTIPRLYDLAQIYKKVNVLTIAGGKHIENRPEEALKNNIDVVVLGEGEYTIRELLIARENDSGFEEIKGIAFIKDNDFVKTEERPLITDFEQLPHPDFGLVRHAKIRMYPISRIRGCNMNCEFCSVKDKTRCASPKRTMDQIANLVETRGARKFFETSDHFAADREEAIEFCRLLSEYQKKNGIRLSMTVQIRLTDAKYPELLQAMRDAGVTNLAIGYESPIDEELNAMRKGYRSEHMIEWTKEYHKYGFFIHGMFIFGYPHKNLDSVTIPLEDRVKRFRQFFKKSRIDTAQVLLTIPLPGTDLRRRLEKEGRLYPLDKISWEYYDGQFPLFKPDGGESPVEVQKAVGQLMKKFYRFHSFWKIVINILFHFPRIVFPATLSLLGLRVRYITRAFITWEKHYFRNYKLRFGGYFIVRGWFKKFHKSGFLKKLAQAEKAYIGSP
jgi:radical SAM superfamily enzyme YgiQ (UPF0313 family)